MGDARAINPLLKTLAEDQDGRVRLSAAQALKEIRAKEGFSPVDVNAPFSF